MVAVERKVHFEWSKLHAFFKSTIRCTDNRAYSLSLSVRFRCNKVIRVHQSPLDRNISKTSGVHVQSSAMCVCVRKCALDCMLFALKHWLLWIHFTIITNCIVVT